MKRLAMVSAVAIASVFGLGLSEAHAQPPQEGLVNVFIDDVTVQVPIAVAANVCNVTVGVLADQLDTTDTTCDADAGSAAVAPAGGGGSGPAQRGLVNLTATDLTIQVPIALAANLCDIEVGVLARQLQLLGNRDCDAVASSTAE